MTLPVSEISILSKTAKFPFWTMDISPWSSKNLSDRNRLKKFMQVGLDVTCMYTDFGGHDPSSFGDTGTLKNGQISLSSIVIKKFKWSESAQKIYASRPWCNMHVRWFWRTWPFQFWRYRYSQKRPNFPFSPWTIIVHGGQKIESAQSIHFYVKCMLTNFGGCGFLVWEILLLSKFGPSSISDHGL